jgi:hypothetical protein
MNENHTMHIQSDALTFWRAGIYFTHAWGVYLLSVYNSFLLLFTTLHTQGKKGFHGRSGREIWCTCYLSYGLATTIVVVERARRSL